MKQRYSVLIGLGIIVLGFYLEFSYIPNHFYTDRPALVYKKHQSEHMYKGRSTPDYYITYQTLDSPFINSTRYVHGGTYFSVEEGEKTTISVNNDDNIDTYHLMAYLVMLIGIIVISMAITDFDLR